MGDSLKIHAGEEKIFPVAIEDDGIALDMTGWTISVEIFWRNKRQLVLTVGSGVEILNLNPGPPDIPPQSQWGQPEERTVVPQFQWKLRENQTITLPLGLVAYANYVMVPASQITEIYGPIYLEVLP